MCFFVMITMWMWLRLQIVTVTYDDNCTCCNKICVTHILYCDMVHVFYYDMVHILNCDMAQLAQFFFHRLSFNSHCIMRDTCVKLTTQVSHVMTINHGNFDWPSNDSWSAIVIILTSILNFEPNFWSRLKSARLNFKS